MRVFSDILSGITYPVQCICDEDQSQNANNNRNDVNPQGRCCIFGENREWLIFRHADCRPIEIESKIFNSRRKFKYLGCNLRIFIG